MKESRGDVEDVVVGVPVRHFELLLNGWEDAERTAHLTDTCGPAPFGCHLEACWSFVAQIAEGVVVTANPIHAPWSAVAARGQGLLNGMVAVGGADL